MAYGHRSHTQVAWAYAQNHEQCPELFNALGDFAAEHVLDFSPTALADTTWGVKSKLLALR